MRKRTALGLGFGALLACGVGYIGLPYLLVQVGNVGLVRRGRGAGYEVALTFDDGPGPETTPRVLDILRGAGVRATFFVVGERAAAHPDLVRRMIAEGHEVESHGFSHRHAWLRPPWQIGRDARRAAGALRDLTGQDVRFFRPPHGAYTLASVLALRGAKLRGAHWTVEAHDWHPGFAPQDVTARVLGALRPGDVIVMHDAGPGAPNTVAALPGLLRELTSRGYKLVPLGELPEARPERPRDLIAREMAALDASYARAHHVVRLGSGAGSLLKAGLAPFPLGGHPEFARGAPMIEVHVDNERLVNSAGKRMHTIRLVRDGMRDLAAEWAARPEWEEARGVFGIGPFGEVLSSLGFQTRELPEGLRRRITRWSNVLHWAYSGEKLRSVKGRGARLGFLPREEFLRKFGPRG